MGFSRAEEHVFFPPGQVTHRVLPEDSGFPARLREIPSVPKSLWFKGVLPTAGKRLIAIVGARAATRGRYEQAYAISAGLGRNGVAVVSGGAFGIDTAAHEGALASGASTFAVLGCGPDIIYPDRNAKLFALIAASGGLISEYPPGTKPRPGQFPARNRIIAGLADAVVVVEAAMRSGALITARLGLSLGRPLFVIPGSPGTDLYLQKGLAKPVSSAEDIEFILAGGDAPSILVEPVHGPMAAIVDAIVHGDNTPVDLGRRLGISLPSVLSILAEAELEGRVKRAAGNTYEVIGRAC